MSQQTATAIELTASLEDYLETIYELVRDRKVARVRDIAEARSVKAGSVTPAMRRLDELGLIKYGRREFIELTAEGEKQARRIYSGHQILQRFFQDFLGLSSEEAEQNACAMEHSLTNEARERFVRLYEFLTICPDGKQLLQRFRHCPEVHGGDRECDIDCSLKKKNKSKRPHSKTLFQLDPGERGRVTQINAQGAIRRRMLDMGILPGQLIEMERVAPAGDPIWIKLGGFQLSLRKKEAESILVGAD
jgi:DtxR family Mn-dependent transcriptional regulator